MNCPKSTIKNLQQAVNGLADPTASQLSGMLDDVRSYLEDRDEETRKLNEAQADAIVNSAGIIFELEETKERLEKMRLIAESAADEAKSLSAFGDILEHSLNEIYILDCKSLRFVHVNRGARHNIGYTMKELSKLTPIDIKTEFSLETFEGLVARLQNNTSTKVEFNAIHLRKDGSTYPVEVQLEESVFHNQPVYVAIIRDITYRVEMEAKNHQLQQELIESSHKAGMAEVATGVLHNVGNILNSVNISVSAIQNRMSHSALENLQRASNLISDNLDNFAEFVRDDNRGIKLPQYLLKVGEALANERDLMNTEFQEVLKNVEHIKQVIDAQQLMAKTESLKQELCPHELINDSLGATAAYLNDLKPRISIEIPDTCPRLFSDKHKILQILTNLLKNAGDSLANCEQTEDPAINLRVFSEDDHILLQVIDNGKGIDEENLNKIFQYGFTTKGNRNGFGLHTSANKASELGGRLTVSNQRNGRGAIFTLALPVANAE